MKKKIYLVCTHPRDQLKFGEIYLFDKLFDIDDEYLCIILDLNCHSIGIPLFVSRFKKFTNIEQARFMAIKLKLGAIKVSIPHIGKQTCDHKAKECIC